MDLHIPKTQITTVLIAERPHCPDARVRMTFHHINDEVFVLEVRGHFAHINEFGSYFRNKDNGWEFSPADQYSHKTKLIKNTYNLDDKQISDLQVFLALNVQTKSSPPDPEAGNTWTSYSGL